MKHSLDMMKGLSECAIIRATFDTLELFAADDPVRADILPVLTEARNKLMRRLLDASDEVLKRPETLDFDFWAFHVHALYLMRKGYGREGINQVIKTDAFDPWDATLYYFPLAGTRNLKELEAMPAPQFVALLLRKVAGSVSEEANYTDKQTFDRNVFEEYVAYIFLQYFAMDRMFRYSYGPKTKNKNGESN